MTPTNINPAITPWTTTRRRTALRTRTQTRTRTRTRIRTRTRTRTTEIRETPRTATLGATPLSKTTQTTGTLAAPYTSLIPQATASLKNLQGTLRTAIRLPVTTRGTTPETTGTLATSRGTTATVRLQGTPGTTKLQTTGTLVTPRGTTATVRLQGTPGTKTLQTTGTLVTPRGTTATVRLQGTPGTTTLQTTGTLVTPHGTTATVSLLGTPGTTTLQTTGTLVTPRGTTATVSRLGTPRTTTLQTTTSAATASGITASRTRSLINLRTITTATRLIPQETPHLTTTETVTSTVLRTTASTKNNDDENELYYRHIGCFKDEGRPRRAMPDHLGTWKGKNAIKECAKKSWKKGYEVFGVQYFGECWSGVNASLTYAKYNHSNGCSSDGVGGHWANDVYAFVYNFTSLIRFKTKENYPYNNQNKDPCKPCEHISRYLNSSRDASRDYKHISTCKHWNWDRKLGVECVIYGKKKTQDEDVNDYYKKLVSVLTEGAKKNKIEGLKIDWKSISVKDTGICLCETTGQPNIKGYFIWSSARISETRTFSCPYGESSATRRCGGNFNIGAEWNTPDDDNCNYKSNKTQELNKISKIKLNSGNAKEVAKNFTKLFKSGSSKDMSSADANLAADMVDKILSVEDRLNETADMVIEIIDAMMEMNASNLKTDVSTRIIKAMDKLAENIPLEEGTTSRVLNSTNLVIQANKVNPSSFKGSTFGIIANKEGGRSVVTSADQTNLFVKLPTAVFEKSNKDSSVRIGFIYFANQNLFNMEDEDNDIENEREPSKEVLSASVYNNNTNTSTLSENVTLTFPRPAGKDLKNSSCVFWKENERTWSGEGCVLCDDNGDDKTSIQCCCNHLTSFAVLFSPEKEPLSGKDEEHARILSIISYVGCGISLAGVILTFLTYSLFRHLRKTNQQPILMNLCVSIALLLIVFAVGIDRAGNRLGCQIVAGLLHYLTLTTIFWMGIEGYNLYLQLVKVMNIYHRKFMLKASIVAWGVPALIVVATVIAAVIEYEMNEDSNRVFYYGNEKVCILHNHLYRIVSWFAPILAILLLNLVMFVLVMYKINSTGAMVPVDTKSNLKKRSWTALAIMSLLGLTWIFGALAISGARLAFEYLFCIFNSLQGFFIFFFHCARIKEVRNQWSFFVSGLGFSHKESETSHQRSRGIGESRHSSEAPYVKVKKWILRKESDSDQTKRKITMSTTIDNKNLQGNGCDDNKVDMELDNVRDLHENDALELSFESKKRSSCSSKDSCSDNSSS